MNNGWTGGQYSIVRVITGIYLLFHFALLLPYGGEVFSDRGVLPDGSVSPILHLFPNILAIADSPAMVSALLVLAAVASCLFIVGLFDRIAAVVIWYALACLFGRNPLISNPSLPFVGWVLLAHACLPAAPFGSLAARGRVDPRGGWQFPPALFLAVWIVMAVAYTYSGVTKLMSPSWLDGNAVARILENPLARPGFLRDVALAAPPLVLKIATWGALALELAFAPLALVRRLRPWIWSAMVLLHVSLLLLVDFADLTLGMLVFKWFAFDPGWIRGTKPGTTDTFFFDGTCGLCHRGVRFCLAEDRTATAFRIAPIGGDLFTATMGDVSSYPDSVIVRTAAGTTLVRSDAFLHLFKRLGGFWRMLASLASVLPRPLRDGAYDLVARVRYRLFGKAKDSCPLLPPDLRSRFVP